jgi:prepilin-type N-terminal cleavage/methylation domain-containing protein
MKLFQKTKGFSLFELIVVIVVVGIVFAIGATALKQGITSSFTSRDLMEATWQGRTALQRISKDILGAHSIDATSTSTSLVLNNYDQSQTTYNQIKQSQAVAQIVKNGTYVLANNITTNSLTLTYYDGAFAIPANNANAQCVNIKFTVRKGYTILPMQTDVCLRN